MLVTSSWQGALLVYVLYALNLALYLLPGCAAAAVIGRRRRLSVLSMTALLLTLPALLGYLSFWLFLWNKIAGQVLSYAVYLVSLITTVRNRRQLRAGLPSSLKVPLLFVLLAGWLYLSLLCLYGDPRSQGAGLANQRFSTEVRPGDNLIPLIFVDKIYARQPVRPFCCGDWLSSDRPPLQAGVVLLLKPLRLVGNIALHYQTLSTALQCLWIFGVWSLLEAAGVGEAIARRVLALMVFSGFLFYNCVYVWPKLFAAALVLLALSFVVRVLRAGKSFSGMDAVLAGLSLGLALMAHPGSVFSLPAFALAIAYRRRQCFPWRALVIAAAIPALFLLSWSLYQSRIDPPGNRLVKMHLAGVIDIDSRTFLRTLRDSYARLSWQELAQYKRSNIRQLVGPDPLPIEGREASRLLQREYIWNAVGLLNLGWLAWAFRRRRKSLEAVRWLVAAALFDLFLWALALFGPYATGTVHSSYADILLLAAALAVFVVALLPGWIYWLLLAAQFGNLLVVWAWRPGEQMVPGFAASAAGVTAALVGLLLLTEESLRLWRRLLRGRQLPCVF